MVTNGAPRGQWSRADCLRLTNARHDGNFQSTIVMFASIAAMVKHRRDAIRGGMQARDHPGRDGSAGESKHGRGSILPNEFGTGAATVILRSFSKYRRRALVIA